MTLTELLTELGKARAAANKTYVEYKKEQEIVDVLRDELLVMLKETGLKSAKNDEFTVSISQTPRVVIVNESALIEWLKETPDIESDVYIGVKRSAFDTLAKTMLKSTGELANGTEVAVTEALNIRSNKK